MAKYPSMTRKEFWEKHDAQCKLEGQGVYDKAAHMALHIAYYAQWAQHIGPLPADLLQRCRLALAKGDEHMNSPYTSLKTWDAMAGWTKGRMRESDGVWSLSFNTCVLKEAARQQLEAEGLGVGTITLMGRRFKITEAFTVPAGEDWIVNDYLEAHPGEGVIHTNKGGLVYIASMADEGEPV